MRRVQLLAQALDLRPAAVAAARALLDDAELRRAARFAADRDRDRFIARHAALRWIVGAATGRPPAAVRWRIAPGGRPVTDGVVFSAAHSSGLLVVALARRNPVGVDVELVRARADLAALARVALSPAEHRAWVRIEPPEQAFAFLRAWTAKEAYLKALGCGLAHDPAQLTFSTGTVGIDGRPPWPVRHVLVGQHLVAVVGGPGLRQ